MRSQACDLNRIFGDLAASVPDGPPGYGQFVFHAGVLPPPPTTLTTDRILFRKLQHEYESWYRADALWMYLSQQKCREFGVFLLACSFHGSNDDCVLAINHPKSEIKRITVRRFAPSLDSLPNGLTLIPFALRYFVTETNRHPWIDDRCTHDLPLLALTNEQDSVAGEEGWRGRDTIVIRASDPATIRLAELLLNAGCPWNEVREYELEGDAGFRGVAPLSAELKIFLPESDGWIYGGNDVP